MDFITDIPGQLNKLPAACVLGIFILVIGLVLKKAAFFPNRYIPFVNIFLGGFGYAYLGNPGSISPDYPHPLVCLFAYGVIIGFVAWGFHKAILKRLEPYIPWFKDSGFDTSPPIVIEEKKKGP